MSNKNFFNFSNTNTLHYKRDMFPLPHGNKTTMTVGKLYPIEIQEVYPADTFKYDTKFVARTTSTFVKPVMDNLFLDIYYFFVPSLILYDDMKKVFGENDTSPWTQTQKYVVPRFSDKQTVTEKTVADYLGLPIGEVPKNLSVLPFRAFARIYNDWFQDENNCYPVHIQKGGYQSSEKLNNLPWSAQNYTGQLPNVAKFHDYFTTCLPNTQKGDPVKFSSILPETKLDTMGKSELYTFKSGLGAIFDSSYTGTPNSVVGYADTGDFGLVTVGNKLKSDIGGFVKNDGSAVAGTDLYSGSYIIPTYTTDMVPPYNLGVSLSEKAKPLRATNLVVPETELPAISINDLRFANALQKMLERDARAGSRYCEYIRAAFGVSVPDMYTYRSEYLGGKRFPLHIQQVAQTSQPTDESPLGQLGAFSLSGGKVNFSKGFKEHGYIIGVACIRQFHTYPQGVDRFWSRTERTDFYDPLFSRLSEQPVYKYELYSIGVEDVRNAEVFGYNEPFADLKFRPNKVTGQARPRASDTLDMWHFADDYAQAPLLSQKFIEETPDFVNRCMSVNSSVQDQFIIDFYFDEIAYRRLPIDGSPKLD